MTHWIRSILIALGVCGIGLEFACRADEKPAFVRGVEFRRAWNSPVRARLDQTPLREMLEQLCSISKIAWVVDRRLDPDQPVSCDLNSTPLSELLPQILGTVQADAVVVGDTVIVGPQESIRWLRTLAELQRAELSATADSPKLALSLSRPLDTHWSILSQPRSVVRDLTQRAKVDLTGLDSIPYDLWGSGDLIGMAPGEALTVLAWQYDLQLKWSAGGRAALVPIQRPVELSRVIPIPEAKLNAARSQFPDLRLTADRKSYRCVGRIEDLESLEQWLKGGGRVRPPPKKPSSDWRTRKFTFKVENQPLIVILKGLREQGTPIEWDEAALTAAGVDLQVRVKIDLQGGSADEFLTALCAPAKLKYVLTAQGATISAP